MDELAAILSRYREPDVPEALLATVVHVRGSAYRRPGARMLIDRDGSRLGTISGGCLESEVVRKAWWWTERGPAIRTFDSSSEDAAADFGLGCSGVLTILFERVGTPKTHRLLEFLESCRRHRAGAVVATVIRSNRKNLSVGDHLLFDCLGLSQHNDVDLEGELQEPVTETAFAQQSRLVHICDADLFVEWVGPPQRLFIFGSGHDVAPLEAMGAMLGWNVTIADSHTAIRRSRFSQASEVFAIPSSGSISGLGIARDDVVVMMTHNFPRDLELLPQITACAPRYLGVLGSRSRAEKLFREAGADLYAANVHAPVGLDIGADNPESIALAIAAEIQAVLKTQPGGHLRSRNGAIHAPVLEVGATASFDDESRIHPVCELRYG